MSLGHGWLYLTLWLWPLMTGYQLVSRLRNIAEHAVVGPADDDLRNTRTTRANWLARMTVAFASGQILGPVLVRLLGDGQWWGWDALAWANAAATLLLLGTGWWLWHGARQSHA